MKKSKILMVIVTTILMMFLLVSNVFALSPNQINAASNVNGTNEIVGIGGQIIGILQTVGVVLSIVILIILGIKYMMGSAEEKAEYKKTMIPYLVGAIFIFAASTLANMVYNFVIGI